MTRRAFLLGLVMASWANLWPAYTSLIAHSSRADHAHLSLAMLIPFTFLLLLNRVLERQGKHLTSTELLTISSMGMVAACMQGEWLSGWFLGVITAPTYFATAENRWADLLIQYLPQWAIIDAHATKEFYEGLTGDHIPLGSWIGPLFWWGTFVGAVLVANASISVILRRQWMENERLPFPVATALLELTGVSGSRGTLRTLLGERLFWVGFWIVFGIIGWNVTSWFVFALPPIPLLHGGQSVRQIVIGQGFPTYILTDSLLTFVFGYFTKSEVLFSLWFFNLLTILQIGVFARLGFSIGSPDPWTSSDPAVGWQNFGGMVVFVLWGLWIARNHLKDVGRKAFGRGDEVDDSGELMSYRASVLGFLFCNLYFILFFRIAGMDWGPIFAFGFATWILYLGLSRIMVEAGLVFMRGPITAQAFTWHLFGVTGMGPVSAALVGLTFSLNCDTKTLGMTAMAHIPRFGAAMNVGSRRRLVPAILIGCLIGASTVFTFILYEGHLTGSYNFGVKSFNGSNDGPVGALQLTASRIQEGSLSTDWNRIAFFGAGSLFTALLIFIRYQFPSFPLHPIGFVFPATVVSRRLVTSIFAIWLVKTVLLKLGGLERYRMATPFFLGLLVGFMAGIALNVAVDIVWFNGQGHEIHVAW